jgi:hypothetical protein
VESLSRLYHYRWAKFAEIGIDICQQAGNRRKGDMSWTYVARIKSSQKDADKEERDMADLGVYLENFVKRKDGRSTKTTSQSRTTFCSASKLGSFTSQMNALP